jgi:hypothetical protein
VAPRSITCGSSRRQAHAAVHVGRGRVDDAHAGQHVVVEDAGAQRGLALGQLGQRVDALGRLRRRLVDRDGAVAIRSQQGDHVRQVQLALRVVRREPGQRCRQGVAPEAVQPDVELVQCELLGGGVARLHDAGDAIALPHDATVGVRRREPAADERAADAVSAGCDCAAHGLGVDQRRVPGEHHDLLHVCRHRLEPHHDGVAGAVGRRLHDDAHVAQRCRDRLGRLRRGDDDDVLGPRRARRARNPGQHRQPAQLVQDLRQRRAHPGAQPAGHDDRGDGSHRRGPPWERARSLPGIPPAHTSQAPTRRP